MYFIVKTNVESLIFRVCLCFSEYKPMWLDKGNLKCKSEMLVVLI